MAKNSREYTTIVEATDQLENIVKNNITPLCGKLLARGLITANQKKALRNANQDVVERAADLVQLVTDKVEQNPQHYYDFIKILAEDKSTYGDVLDVLELPAEPGSRKDTASTSNAGMAFLFLLVCCV